MKTSIRIFVLQYCQPSFLLLVINKNQLKAMKKWHFLKKSLDSLQQKYLLDISKLTPGDRKALDKIIEAAQLMDPIYLRQVWRGNVELLKKLETEYNKRQEKNACIISAWIWARGHCSIITSHLLKRHPRETRRSELLSWDMTKEEFNKWIAVLQRKEREQATGFFLDDSP